MWNTRTYAIAFNFLLVFGLFMFIVRCIFSWRNWPNHTWCTFNCQWTMKMSYGNGETDLITLDVHLTVSGPWKWVMAMEKLTLLWKLHINWIKSVDNEHEVKFKWHMLLYHKNLTMMKMAWWGDTRLTDIYSPWSKCGVNTFFLVQETLIQQQKSDIVNNVAADEKNQ